MSGERLWLRHTASIAAGLAIVLGTVVASAVLVMRTVVLHPGTYTTALVEADAYERVYTEVLADPELAAVTNDLLGDLGVPSELAPQVRSLTNNVVRWAVPPSMLRTFTERVVSTALAYVRGDTPRLNATVAIGAVADRLPATVVREVRTVLASAADRAVGSIEELRVAAQEIGDELAAGRIPVGIPALGGSSFDPQEVTTAILDGLGDRVDDDTRALVLAAVLADEEREAVIDAAALAVTGHAEAVAERLRREPVIDLATVVAERVDRPVGNVVGTFDTVRDLARWTEPWVGIVAAVVAVAGIVALWRLHGRSVRLAWWVAGALVTGALAVATGWLLARSTVSTPLTAATTAGGDGWSLPVPAAALMRDVAGGVGSRIASVVWRCIAVLALVGAAVAAVAAIRDPRVLLPRRDLAVAAVVAVAVVGVGAMVLSRPQDQRACNGHVELCDRRFDEVTSAATHNSMSSPEVVPVWPEHDGGLTEQLDAGVRTLLIDTHHWPPLESAAQLADAVTPGEIALPRPLAEALYAEVVTVRDGRPGAFLCHNHCAFGAQPLGEGLDEIATFLAANPHEVVTLIIQDAISPAETAAAFEAAGLTELVHAQEPDDEWPTLGEMIDRGRRLVVFAENERPPPAWYVNAFEAMQETPFLFLSEEEFSCAPNRGDPEASLFLMNHWVQRIAPDRADAVRVNTVDVLVERARQCERERGLRPNFLAVNFYNIGDVVEAADVLNGVALGSRASDG